MKLYLQDELNDQIDACEGIKIKKSCLSGFRKEKIV